jgi:hypothetical protein
MAHVGTHGIGETEAKIRSRLLRGSKVVGQYY